MKLTKRQAKALSIKKWEYIVGNDGSEEGLERKYPELEFLKANCGYCEKYYNEYKGCDKCPINLPPGFSCGDKLHPWYKWDHYRSKANAQTVLDLIRES